MPYTPVTTSYTDPMAIHLREGQTEEDRVHDKLADAIIKLQAIEKTKEALSHQSAYTVHQTDRSNVIKLKKIGEDRFIGPADITNVGNGNDITWTIGLARITEGYTELDSLPNIRVMRGKVLEIKVTSDGYEFEIADTNKGLLKLSEIPENGDILYLRN